jgi:hypothetical protein
MVIIGALAKAFAPTSKREARRKTINRNETGGQAFDLQAESFVKEECARNPSVFRRPGGFGGVSIPDPISNSAVNRSSANGTSS